jgi:hypothetical protein
LGHEEEIELKDFLNQENKRTTPAHMYLAFYLREYHIGLVFISGDICTRITESSCRNPANRTTGLKDNPPATAATKLPG